MQEAVSESHKGKNWFDAIGTFQEGTLESVYQGKSKSKSAVQPESRQVCDYLSHQVSTMPSYRAKRSKKQKEQRASDNFCIHC